MLTGVGGEAVFQVSRLVLSWDRIPVTKSRPIAGDLLLVVSCVDQEQKIKCPGAGGLYLSVPSEGKSHASCLVSNKHSAVGASETHFLKPTLERRQLYHRSAFKIKMPFDLAKCARPNILALEPYRCARE